MSPCYHIRHHKQAKKKTLKSVGIFEARDEIVQFDKYDPIFSRTTPNWVYSKGYQCCDLRVESPKTLFFTNHILI